MFRHALKINEAACIGCSRCIKVCPTEALRVSNGKAVLHGDWCVDCGECYRICPSRAIVIEDDDFKRIFSYKHRVLLVPELFVGQFNKSISQEEIYHTLLELGFTQVVECESSVDLLADSINQYVEENPKPIISTFCPAVVRLIQVSFPSLVDNLMHIRQPLTLTAALIKKQLLERGEKEDEIGIFYITPCAAKVASVKAPVGDEQKDIAGVINMSYLYSLTYKSIKQGHKQLTSTEQYKQNLSAKSIRWTLTNGEASCIKGRSLAIDGIDNVVEFLEQLENEDSCDFDFLELRACDESCPGGILTLGNRFLAVERMNNMARQASGISTRFAKYADFVKQIAPSGKIEERSMVKYDRDITKAIEKMEKSRTLQKLLPNIDCGACGAPSCEALANDIVRGGSELNHCIFIQKMQEEDGVLSQEQSRAIMEKIWGKNKIRREE